MHGITTNDHISFKLSCLCEFVIQVVKKTLNNTFIIILYRYLYKNIKLPMVQFQLIVIFQIMGTLFIIYLSNLIHKLINKI